MNIKKYYVLELHWGRIEKVSDDSCILHEAYFSGPVLKNAREIDKDDRITLDLTPQYSRILTSFYFVELTWKDVRYADGKVYLGDARLNSDNMNLISKLSDTDYVVIDTENHEESVHMYNLVYKGAVLTKEGREH